MKNMSYLLVSPIRLAMYAGLIYLLFTLIPPSFYEYYMHERNLMFLDLKTMFYVLFSIFSFIVGCMIYSKIKIKYLKVKLPKIMVSINLYFGIPLFIANLIMIYLTFDLLKLNPQTIYYLISYQGNEIKSNIISTSFYNSFIYVYIGIVFWTFYQYLKFKESMSIILRFLVWMSVILVILNSILTLARYIMLPFISGLLILLITSSKNKYKKFFYFKIIASLIFMIIIFMIFSVVRGVDVIYSLLGYGPASFNRLSAMLKGDLYFDVPKLYYLTSQYKGGLSYYEIIMNEHYAVYRASLDGSLNWVTAYGYLYYSLGNFMFVYFFFLGFLTAITWSSFLREKSWAIVFYPWLAATILLWFTYHIFAYTYTFIILVTGILISFYTNFVTIEPLIKKSQKESLKTPYFLSELELSLMDRSIPKEQREKMRFE